MMGARVFVVAGAASPRWARGAALRDPLGQESHSIRTWVQEVGALFFFLFFFFLFYGFKGDRRENQVPDFETNP